MTRKLKLLPGRHKVNPKQRLNPKNLRWNARWVTCFVKKLTKDVFLVVEMLCKRLSITMARSKYRKNSENVQ